MRLHELHINNFKFFPRQDPGSPLLSIEGKNLLIYGENGSGKSTIYWALYTLLESGFKISDKGKQRIHQYFTRGGEFGLVNIYAGKGKKDRPFIKAVLKDDQGNRSEYNLNGEDAVISAAQNNSRIRESCMASDFLNYRVIQRLHFTRHSEDNDLFGWFEHEVFPYIIIKPISGTESVEAIYKKLKSGPDQVKSFDEINKLVFPNPAMREHQNPVVRKDYKIYQKYVRAVENWNRKVSDYLKELSKKANEILKQDFKQNFEFQLKLKKATHDVTIQNPNWKEPLIELIIPKYEGKRQAVKRAHSFLNEAKWSAIGLAIRFAIIEDWTTRPNTAELKALIIDDMLLSLDMCNRDIVLNLLLDRYVNHYQLIILTHDRYFYELTKAKIDARNKDRDWLKLEMYEDEKAGRKFPLIIKTKTNLEKARSFYKQKEFQAAANHLRKATECFVYEYVPKKNHYDKRYNNLNLSQLINKSRAVARANGLPITLIQELDLMRANLFNPGSHYDVYTPIFQNDLIHAIETLEQISLLTNLNL